MTLAVTAASGQLGTLVIDHLLQRVPASDVVAVIRNPDRAQPLVDRGVDVRIASYDDPDALRAALDGVNRVLLISGSEVGQRFGQHRNVIDAAIAAGVSRLLYTSVLAADTSSLPVAPEHVQTEEYLESTDLDHVLLRNGWYHENYLPAIDSAAQTGSLLTSAGDGLVASASREDYAEAAAVLLASNDLDAAVYELGGDHAWDQDELASVLSDATGKPVQVAQVDGDQQVEILTDEGVDAGLAGFLAATDASIREGGLNTDSGQLSAVLGRPTTPLADVLKRSGGSVRQGAQRP